MVKPAKDSFTVKLAPFFMSAVFLMAGLVSGVGADAFAQSSKSKAGSQGESGARQYCQNVVDVAAEQRIAWQMRNLIALRSDVAVKIAELEMLREDVRLWLEKRDVVLGEVEEHVVRIYGRMRPDAAAEQMATLDAETATVVLAKLKAREASAILNEMEPARAALLTQSLTELTRPLSRKGS